jgi:DNA polymerase-1
MLRSIFRARPGHILSAWDLSQIELRITAAFSGDEVMGHAFKTGLDLHSNLAANLFGVPYEVANSPENKSTMRDPCKTIHYLLLYGAGGDKLFEELVAAGIKRFTREDCFDLIRDTWKVYNGAGRWVRNQAQEARFRGFAASFLGRRRFLPGTQLVGDRWPILSLRREAERQAFNHPVQAGAGELLKRTEVTVWNEVYPAVKEAGHYFRLWLQVHDELMGETTEAAYPMVDQLMKGAMTQDSWLTDPIPIETDSARGAHWGEL